MGKHKVSVIVPIYIFNDDILDITKKCIEMYENSMENGDELVVVDDCSPLEHDIECIKTPKNMGNSGAWHHGAQHAENDILLFSDNDVFPLSSWRNMLKEVDTYDVVFPMVFNMSTGQMQSHLAGECWMIKRALYFDLGGLDLEYGSYFEDTDMFMRVINNGGALHVCGEARVSHKSQSSIKEVLGDDNLRKLFEKNKKRYEEKFGGNYPYLV